MSEKEILRLEHVSKEYKLKNHQTVKAVTDILLSVFAGECVAIVGESGCGKSTLAKLITCVEEATSGRLFFEGKEITHLKTSEKKEFYRFVQMIFQNPSAAFSPRMRIGKFLMEPWINFEHDRKESARKKALSSLESVKLPASYFSKYPYQLSGGELQRVCIARAVVRNPKLLICDEATSALDVSTQKQVIELLDTYRKEKGITTLFICHDLALAEQISDRVVVLCAGKIVEILKADNLQRDARHPYTKSLLESVKYFT